MATNPTYFQHIDFVVQGTSPQEIIDFKFPVEIQEHIHDLMSRNANGEQLSPEETFQVQEFLDMEHMMMMLKARALQIVNDR